MKKILWILGAAGMRSGPRYPAGNAAIQLGRDDHAVSASRRTRRAGGPHVRSGLRQKSRWTR